MIIGLYDTSIVYDIVRTFGDVELPSGSCILDDLTKSGECEKFLYEDADGFGVCGKTNEECCCCDKCHITHGKP